VEYPKFAGSMSKLRSLRNKTVYDVAEYVGVSHTYISQIENGKKLPSKKVLFPLVHYLGRTKGYRYEKTWDVKTGSLELIKIYSDYKDMSYHNLINEYLSYVNDLSSIKSEQLEKAANALKNNRVKVSVDNDDFEELDKPYFDIKWLLTQKDYAVFFGRDYDAGGVLNVKDKIGKNDLYQALNQEDTNTILDLIEAYLSNKYRKVTEKDFV